MKHQCMGIIKDHIVDTNSIQKEFCFDHVFGSRDFLLSLGLKLLKLESLQMNINGKCIGRVILEKTEINNTLTFSTIPGDGWYHCIKWDKGYGPIFLVSLLDYIFYENRAISFVFTIDDFYNEVEENLFSILKNLEMQYNLEIRILDLEENPILDLRLSENDYNGSLEYYLKSKNLFYRSKVSKYRELLKRRGYFMEKQCAKIDKHRTLKALIDQHIQRWGMRGFNSMFLNQSTLNFIYKVINTPISTTYSLFNGKEYAATAFCFIYMNVLYLGVHSFNFEMSKYSPGIVLLSYIIEDAINTGIKIFDFGPGRATYKDNWNSGAIKRWQVDVKISK